MSRIPLTIRGAEKVREEIRTLKTEARPRVTQAIAVARGHGDLKENAEYHAAKDEQGFIEARIRDLESLIANAEVIDVTRLIGNTKVLFGATVSLVDEADGKASRYQIVGEYEADMKLGMISISSPLARALIGKVEGDVASFTVPAGEKNLEIVRVEYF
ncbi:MAG: transcription elongation factor GreA [Chromatiales bacterium]|nr:MAG: transcription elongation factor GreA [Chromatiales bacterium]